MANHTERIGPGPVPGPPTEKATVLLDPDLKKWGKKQPGGLSETVRNLMREAFSETDNLARITATASERVLSREWDSPAEDDAWRHL